jgi:hypothetical protein
MLTSTMLLSTQQVQRQLSIHTSGGCAVSPRIVEQVFYSEVRSAACLTGISTENLHRREGPNVKHRDHRFITKRRINDMWLSSNYPEPAIIDLVFMGYRIPSCDSMLSVTFNFFITRSRCRGGVILGQSSAETQRLGSSLADRVGLVRLFL